MKIQEMLYGWQARASEDELNQMRLKLTMMMLAAEGCDALNLIYDDLKDTISSIDTDIEGMRREERYAEQNAKYREDRPNA
jgi:hypothetical protein